ncbi:MAG: transglycosylase SLT domain-containing protein [Methylococcaceae bacterium]|nr:transglycosylase SLT domain-containing protein [Methylococcaceae bacterium]
MPKPLTLLSSTLCLLLATAVSLAANLERQRSVFLQAEQAIKQGRQAEAENLLPALTDYPLYPHLLFQKLDRELENTSAIQDFLARYGQTRQAVLLRQHWLERMAEQGRWADFAQHYRESDSLNLQCNHYLAFAKLGRQEEAFAGAQKLWPTGNSLPESCDRLFSLWQSSGAFSTEHLWKRLSLAMQKGNRPLATYLQRLLPAPLQPQADVWQKVHDNPKLALSCSGLDPGSPMAGLIFADAMDRLAADEPLLAQTAWALHKDRYAIDPQEAARLDRRTALALAAQRYGQAGAYLLELPRTSTDAQIRGWRVRAALARQDWPMVLAAFEMLEPEEKNQAQWRYWRARALEALGDQQGARENYQWAAKERDFYGFTAADRIGYPYPLTSQSSPVGEADLNRLAERPPFAAISELRMLNRDGEVRSEWLYAIKFLPQSELVIAAKLAQQWGLDNLAITTAAKAGYWDDLSLRFPLGYYQPVLQNAQSQQIDPAMVYGLIRRESAFDPNAGSSAGARGLMQLMPATGEMMARRFKESLPGPNELLEPERNLRYGTAYFRGLLEKFRHHFALAAAAYNAGPNRIERWLPVERPMPTDLWMETIPFSETRQYVAAVMSYAVIYQSRLNQPLRRIGAYLTEVQPGSKTEVKPEQVVSIPACE